MYRILIADDEGIMLESIKNTILENFRGDCELSLAKTGREVIERAESFRPDIAFIDIQMPGINGIQAIERIREMGLNTVLIIITAYDKFSYAKEAVSLGVMEFVMKPVGKRKIVELCAGAMQKVNEARRRLSDDLSVRERLEIVTPMLESGFFYSLLSDEGADMAHAQKYLEILGVNERFGYITVLEVGEVSVGSHMTNAIGAGFKIGRRYEQVRETISGFLSCLIGPVMGNRIVLLTPYGNDTLSYDDRAQAIRRTRSMIEKLENAEDIRIRGGIGSVSLLVEARKSYKEAIIALRKSENHVVCHADLPNALHYDGEYPLDLENLYLQRGVKGAVAETLSCAEEFFDWMIEHNNGARSNIEVKVLEMVMRLEKAAFDAGDIRYGFLYREDYLPQLREAADEQGLKRWFLDRTREVCENIHAAAKHSGTSIVSKVKKYIDENFSKDITLDDAARLVDLSPYYFSKLFKTESGENFSEYLGKVRIGNAKKLLANPNYSVKEICVMCGYSDPNYFSRIFRKQEGMTPSEYRER